MRDNFIVKVGVSGLEVSIEEVSIATAVVDEVIKEVVEKAKVHVKKQAIEYYIRYSTYLVEVEKAVKVYENFIGKRFEELVYDRALNRLRCENTADFLLIATSQIEKEFDNKLFYLLGTTEIEDYDKKQLLNMVEKYIKYDKVKDRLKQHIQGLA